MGDVQLAGIGAGQIKAENWIAHCRGVRVW
jgi:hypothetical protein